MDVWEGGEGARRRRLFRKETCEDLQKAGDHLQENVKMQSQERPVSKQGDVVLIKNVRVDLQKPGDGQAGTLHNNQT